MPKQELAFRSKITNAAGLLGYAPDPRKTSYFNLLGAFFTNPISLLPRSPAESRCAISFPGGVLLHSGYPNPGLVKVIEKYDKQWRSAAIPVILHIMLEEERSLDRMLRLLEDSSGISGIEISFKPGSDLQMMSRTLKVAATEWPVIAHLEVNQIKHVVELTGCDDLSAISITPLRGRLPSGNLGKDTAYVTGRMFGAALFPLAMEWLQQALALGVPVIASGGSYFQGAGGSDAGSGCVRRAVGYCFMEEQFSFPGGW